MPHSSFLILNYSFPKVLVNKSFQRFYRSGSSQPVLRRVHAVVYQLVDGRYRNVHPRVRRSIIDVHRAVVIGHNRTFRLHGGNMTSPDIRAGIALLIAAMSADGISRIHNIEQIDRGYQDIEGRLNAIGARITRI